MNPYPFYGYATDPISRFPVNFPARQVVPGFAPVSNMVCPSQGVTGYIATPPYAMSASPAPVVGHASQNGGHFLNNASASALPTAHAAPSPAVLPPGSKGGPPGSKDEPPENAWLKTAMAAGIGLTGIGGIVMVHRRWKQRKAAATAPPTPPTSEQKKASPTPAPPASERKVTPGPKPPQPKDPPPVPGPKAVPTPEPVTPKVPPSVPPQKQSASAPKADAMESAMEERARKLKSRMAKLNQEQRAVVKKHLEQLPKEHQIAWMSHISQLSREQWAAELAHLAEQQAESRLKRWGGKAITLGFDNLLYSGMIRDAAQGGEWLTGKNMGWLKSNSWSTWGWVHLPITATLTKILPASVQEAIRNHSTFTTMLSQNSHFFLNLPLSTVANHGLSLMMNEEGPLQKGLDRIGLISHTHRQVLRPIRWGLGKGKQLIENYVVSHGLLTMLLASVPTATVMGLGVPTLLAGGLTLGWKYLPETIKIPEKIKIKALPQSIPIKDIISTYGFYAPLTPVPGWFEHLPRINTLLRLGGSYGVKKFYQALAGLRR